MTQSVDSNTQPSETYEALAAKVLKLETELRFERENHQKTLGRAETLSGANVTEHARAERLQSHITLLINTVCLEAGSFPASAPTDEETIKRAIADCKAKTEAAAAARIVAWLRSETVVQDGTMACSDDYADAIEREVWR